jgi:hypothetical protein
MKWIVTMVLAVAVAGTLALSGAPALGADENARLPVTKVILYKHGVAYVERTGFVMGAEGAELQFKADQMNDLLKSLAAIDLGEGSIASISYGSSKTTERLLSEYSFDLRKDTGVPGLLKQLQGAGVELRVGGKTLEGSIVSVEARTETRDGETVRQTYKLALLTEDNELRSFDTSEITSVEFTDDKLREDLGRVLDILFSAHRRDTKTVTIRTAAPGRRELLVGYVVEAPVWKATYRIALSEKKQPLLQGWAIVDNTTEEGWKDIELALVSGMPVSFVMNLYDPRYKARPVIDETVPPAPVVAFGAANAVRKADRAQAQARAAAPALEKAKELKREAEMYDLLERQKAAARGVELGQLFEYRIDQPVTIERDHSALIPIVSKPVEATRLSLYNETVRTANPMSALGLKNTTGLTLEGGPVTIYEGSAYVGEALFDTLKDQDERYLSYAVDLGTTVSTKLGSSQQAVYRVQITRGILITHYKLEETKNYSLTNLDARGKTVVIEHPFRPGWELVGDIEPIKRTDQLYRFEVKLPAREKVELAVKEQYPRSSSYAIANITPDQIAFFVRQKYVDEKLHRALQEIVAIKNEIAGLDRELKDLERERDDIFKDQERLRANIRALGNTAEEKELRGRYVARMAQEEDALQKIDARIGEITTRRNARQKDLDDAIAALAADYRL